MEKINNSSIQTDTEDGAGASFGPCLPASTFELPTHANSDQYELWSIRVPVDCDVTQVFHGKTLTITGHSTNSTRQNIICPISNLDGDIVHALIQDEGADFQSHRILSKVVDDDNDDPKMMKPAYKFDRAFHLLQDCSIVQRMIILPQHQVDTMLAPNVDVAPAPESNGITGMLPIDKRHAGKASKALPQQIHSFRAAYEPIPQKTNLKRRWIPSGSCSTAVFSQQEELGLKFGVSDTSNSKDEHATQQVKTAKIEDTHEIDRKEKKRLKKLAKKMKKERKSSLEEIL
jgi:hypothetical protein